MNDVSWKGMPFTFLLALVAMALTFWGMYLNMLPPDVFVEVVWAALAAYGFTSGARKIAGAFAVRKGSVPAETTTTNGGAG